MQHDDREHEAPAGGPDPTDGEGTEEAPRVGQAGQDSADEFETAPSATRLPDTDQPAGPASGDETPPAGEAAWPVEEPRSREPDQAQAAEESEGAFAGPTEAAESLAPVESVGVVEPGASLPPREAEAYPASPAPAPSATSAAAHSVPATPVGESTQCPRCGTENRPGVAFCRNCGQRLVAAGVASTLERPGTLEGTQACPRCGTLNRAGVAFCQNCGANLRASSQPAPGYVPPPAQPSAAQASPPEAVRNEPSGGALLGPLVLLVGAVGISTAWVLPFAYGGGSLWERSFGSPGGYGIAFWNGYAGVSGGLLDKAYFGFAAAAPILVAVLLLLVISGFLRAAPGALQAIGLLVSTLWAIGLIALFVVLEVAGNWGSDLVAVLRLISPAGIIFLLSGLIVLIGCATRFARS